MDVNELFRHPEAGIWWPCCDKDPIANYNFAKKRVTDCLLTAAVCRKHDLIVQAGGWVGMWPLMLAPLFKKVWTFEMMGAAYDALRRNTMELPNVFPSGYGLSDKMDSLRVKTHSTVGSWRIDPGGDSWCTVRTIDSWDFQECDAIILDVEGHEVEALRGAAKTIAKFRPVLHVEELPRSKDAIQAHIAGLGYVLHQRVHGDAIYVPN